MALQSFNCPNCGGAVQMDDNLEKGFCMYCGSEIHAQEEIGDSKKKSNALILADRAFDAGNYEECYNYCLIALECDTNNAHATFRKGLCAAYLSYARVNELEQGLKSAKEILSKASGNTDHDIYVIFTELLEYIRATFTLNCDRARSFAYPNLAAANNAFSIIASLTELCGLCAELITDDMIKAHPTYENDKKICLEQGLELCEEGLSALKYCSGYQQVKRGDRYENKEVYESVRSPYGELQKKYQAQFKNDFNNLPSTKAALMGFDGEIAKLQKEIDTFTSKLDVYFDENPEIKKEYKKSAVLYNALAIIAFAGLSIASGALLDAVSPIVYGLVITLLAGAFIALGVLAIMRNVTYSKNRKRILSELPAELTCLKNVHDQSKAQMRSVKREKAAFEKKNVKK